MNTNYSKEINVQILVFLMKAHGIRKIIASPGTTNINFVASVQQDSYFELYSSVDERSAAYIACGLAAESGEPVVLSCTGATASRNYIPGLTEAFYRKLPILAVTSTQHVGRIGQNMAQVIDRRSVLNDIVKLSIQAPIAHTQEDAWALNVQINRALLELRRHGGGPVHINLETTYNTDFTLKKLPETRIIQRISRGDKLPQIPAGRVAIFVGAHQKWSERLINAVDEFCSKYNGIVLCDQTSNYRGKFRAPANLVAAQAQYTSPCLMPDLMIDIGNVSGSYMPGKIKQVWRVNPDGEIRDTFKKLTLVFEMEEAVFFEAYNSLIPCVKAQNTYYAEFISEHNRISCKLPELPFSNPWIAQYTVGRLPEDSVLYLGIYNSLRSWNFFETPRSVTCYSNTGGFGIDGGVSSLLGMSLASKNKLCFGVVGDLGFFYDMNALGNRHIGNNIRLMLINNGRGTEFRNYNHPAAQFGDDADAYMAAAGHYGFQSRELAKHYAVDLGFEYMSASNKDEYQVGVDRFLTPENTDKPMLFEVFTDYQCESRALEIINNLETQPSGSAKQLAKNILGEKGVEVVKKFIGH